MRRSKIKDMNVARIASPAPLKRLLLNVRNGETGEISGKAHQEGIPLSCAQERIWILDQFEPGNIAYNTCSAFRLDGPLDVACLRNSLGEVIRRHDVLRTTFGQCDGDPVQVISGSIDIDLTCRDLRKLPENERESTAFRLINEDIQRPFDLERGPLLRPSLLRLDEDAYIIFFVVHHIIFDGWSTGVMCSELSEIYNAQSAGDPSPLPELPLQYADYSLWQRGRLRGGALEAQLSYWKELLREVPAVTDIPGARPRTGITMSRAASHPIKISETLTGALRNLSREGGATLFMTLLAAFKILLHRYTGRGDIAVGSPIANRNRLEIEPLIGFFANTLVLRTDLSGEPTFRELLRRVREVALGAYTNQDIPFEKVVEEIQPERNPRYNPIFQVLFVLQNVPPKELTLRNINATPIEFFSGLARFDLTLSLTEEGRGIRGFIRYNADLFDNESIARMAGHFRVLLESIVADPDQTIGALSILAKAERAALLASCTGPSAPYPMDRCIHEIFERQVELTAESPAVCGEKGSLTYRELNSRANRLACLLAGAGVGPEVRVGIFMDSSPDMIVAVLSVLKAGGAYVPIDPYFPADRVSFIIGDSGMPVLLTQTSLRQRIPDCPVRALCIDDPEEILAGFEDSNPRKVATVERQAYVLYTSGSTGQPKGVIVEQRQLLNYMYGIMEQTGMVPGESYAMVQPLNVDSCKTVIFPSLCSGGTLHVLPRDRAMDPEAVADYFHNHPIDILKIAPSHLAALMDSPRAPQIMPRHLLIVGGESSHWEFMERIAALAPATTVFNHYGPTEATVGVTIYKVTRSMGRQGKTVPLGRPLPNMQVYVLDSAMQPVPVNIPGEIWIGGEGVARGYLNRPELTARRFVEDIFSAGKGSRLYRTGDLAYRLPDGNIVYLGRTDTQIKIRGFRIEPGEVEAAIRQHPDGLDALVVAQQRPSRDGTSLVAYLAPRSRVPLVREMKDFLRQKLPDYMVPKTFVVLDNFPLTRHGKIDLTALPEPDTVDDECADDFIAPRNREEMAVAEVWKEVLELEHVGIRDNFFEIGGHSLLATRVISRLRRIFGPNLPLRSIFENPTIDDLTRSILIEGGAKRERSGHPADKNDSGGTEA